MKDESHPLEPVLTATETRLQTVIDDVCDELVIAETDTAELIRVEEALALASEAAKKAISLRRRIMADGEAPPPIST